MCVNCIGWRSIPYWYRHWFRWWCDPRHPSSKLRLLRPDHGFHTILWLTYARFLHFLDLPHASHWLGPNFKRNQQAEGYVIGSSIKHIPVAGRDITSFVQQLLRDRGENSIIPPEDQLRVSQEIKEKFGYTCSDIVKEFKKYDDEPEKMLRKYEGIHSVTGKVCFPSWLLFFYFHPISLWLSPFHPSTFLMLDIVPHLCHILLLRKLHFPWTLSLHLSLISLFNTRCCG